MQYFENYTLYETMYIFIIYSFIGWCTEVVYAASVHGKFINRGFDIGPVCPIYGFGVLSVLLFLEPVKDQWALLFVLSAVFTSMIEFFGGFLLEKFFHEKWWDYSNEPFNIKGYICLRFSLLWGGACVLVINVIHPTIMTAIHLLPMRIGVIILILLYTALFSDVTITLINLMKIRKHLLATQEIEKALSKLSISIGTNLSGKTLDIIERSDELKDCFEEKETKLKANISEKRAEAEELLEKLKENMSEAEKYSVHIRKAFPNIGKGKYKHIFKK
ncbi:MAG: hypothetical protein II589_01405 [Clostridia bacterium]|nr:hypothetical protein [Clostridia bacterium]